MSQYDERGNTPFITAVSNGDIATVSQLLDGGVDPNEQNYYGTPAIMYSLSSEPVYDLLVRKGANVKVTDDCGWTPLMRAAMANFPTFDNLLTQGIDVNAQCEEGGTALMQACKRSHLSCVQKLLGVGADVNVLDNVHSTALIHAICSNLLREVTGTSEDRVAVVKLLLDNAGMQTINQVNKHQSSALRLAISRGHKELILVLLEKNADASPGPDGETVIELAQRSGQPEQRELFEEIMVILKSHLSYLK